MGNGRAANLGRERERVHTVAFDTPEAAIEAARTFRADGLEVADAHTPFAVHGLAEAMGLRQTRIPAATLAGGLLGGGLGFGFQAWTHAVDWPLNIGGKSNLAWPAMVPVGFETTVLLAALATVAALLVKGRLFPRFSGRTPDGQPCLRVTDDRFVLLIAERDATYSDDRFHALCKHLGACEVVDTWRVT